MVGRRHLYQRSWYKKMENAFVQALDIRFQMILIDEAVPSAEEFVHALLTHKTLRAKFTAPLAEIVTAVDRRARTCNSPSQ